MTNKRTDRRPARRMGAEARDAQRLARSTEDQLALVNARGGEGSKEAQRLMLRLQEAKPKRKR